MKKITLNVIGDIQYHTLLEVFLSNNVDVVDRADAESEIVELFFYCSPEFYLASFCASDLTRKELIQDWKKQSIEQVNYVLANQKNCFLIDLDYVITNPQEFLIFVKEVLDIDIKLLQLEALQKVQLIESSLCLIEEDWLQEVYEDTLASADFFRSIECGSLIERLKTYMTGLISDNEQLRVHLEKQRAENEKLHAESQQEKTNSELALLQVAQLQEELEASAISHAELKKALENALTEQNKQQLEKELLKAELEQQKAENDKLHAESRTEKSSNELALLQVAQLQEELETSFNRITELTQNEIAHLSEIDQLKVNKELQEKDNNKLQEAYSDLECDCDLAFLQIAQLQEELQFYFTKSQEGNVSPFTNESFRIRTSAIKHNLELTKLSKGTFK